LQSSKNIPKLKDLCRELEGVVEKWKSLMLELGVEHTVIATAVYNYSQCCNSLYEQKLYVFNYWLKNDRNASWSRVIDALKKIDERNLASQLQRKYAWKDPKVFAALEFLIVYMCIISYVGLFVLPLSGCISASGNCTHP